MQPRLVALMMYLEKKKYSLGEGAILSLRLHYFFLQNSVC